MNKILIVDDDAGILKQLKWALEDEYQVLTASSKEEALRVIDSDAPSIVALDVNLNGARAASKEGIDILEEIMSKNASTKVIMVTGNDTKDIAIEAINKGAFDYYLKPVDIDELRIILKRVCYIQNLEKENRRLMDETYRGFKFEDMIGSSPQMNEVFRLIKRVAPADVAVLVSGESGTGKELAVRAIHYLSSRKDAPFTVINCGAIPENLLESELFGHEKGAFTDAHAQRKGKLETANKGTIFLDEIGEMSLGLQVKILRFLQEHVIERVGGNNLIELDIRVIAATNKDLRKRIKEGLFREDLYYRLSVMNVELPPLRERGEDILLLAHYFLNKFKADIPNKKIKGFTKQAKEMMRHFPWAGNIREMENKVRRALILAENSYITPSELGFAEENTVELYSDKLLLKEARQSAETRVIKKAFQEAKGNISLAAKILGVTRPTLYDLMSKYDIAAQ